MRAIRTACLVTAILTLPATAWGACRDRDLEGTFDLRAESTGDYGTVTTVCEIAVGRNGTVSGGAACQLETNDGTEAEAKVDGGEIDVSRSCRVTGRILIDGYPSVITHARMSVDKNRVTGSGTNAHDGSALTFTATRQVDEVAEAAPVKKRWWSWFWR